MAGSESRSVFGWSDDLDTGDQGRELLPGGGHVLDDVLLHGSGSDVIYSFTRGDGLLD